MSCPSCGVCSREICHWLVPDPPSQGKWHNTPWLIVGGSMSSLVLTCSWQVGGRSDIPFPEQVELDGQYIESQNIGLDITLLLQTIPAVILGKGAY